MGRTPETAPSNPITQTRVRQKMTSKLTSSDNNALTCTEVDAFLAKMKDLCVTSAAVGGRLIFALDATASRQQTWNTACQLQADMFREVAAAGGLEVQLVFYRGYDQCSASRWTP